MLKIGFIGLGHMGSPMASNLIKAGFSVHVYDLNATACQALVSKGAILASTIAQLAAEMDFIFSSVQTSRQVSEICLSPEGIFANAHPNLTYIDCSSIDVRVAQHLHDEAYKFRIAMLDAPVSGGVVAAANGTLTIMVGGDELTYERALPVLQPLAKKVVHAGGAGHGQAAKICNNLLLGVSMIGVCEAFALASKIGLDAKKFFEISSSASGQCWAMTSYCPVPGIVDNVPANKQYQPGFTAKMMLKDLRLAQHAAESVAATIPLGATAAELYELFVNQGQGEKDFSAIINFINQHLTEH